MEESRKKIDEIDREIVRLFKERMNTAANVAEYKREKGLPVHDPARERQLLAKISELSGSEFSDYGKVLYSTILSLSKSYQRALLGIESDVYDKITKALDETEKMFPETAKVVCQGVEGAYSGIAAGRLFSLPDITYCPSFDSVFDALDKGECEYGVLPLENSTAGSVVKIYDLMMHHNFNIVRSVRIKIDHCLLAKRGAELKDIKEIFSHEQAINQCSQFIKAHPEIKFTPVANTAVASKAVAMSEREDVAALSSRHCAELYGLSNLASGVQDQGNNYTRFICISKNLEIYPGADKTTIMAATGDTPGALYQLLSLFFAHGINITKLESRPMPTRDFEYIFYLDLDVSIYSPKLKTVLSELERYSGEFRYLGSYTESVG
ncbi:MAG: bifunctional chorismate mutase/prephenate dehydratase [Ruminococcaceae bacterium]|nr:bifunctional chorismate mutase/prephenate dehydratase [Oscillospiraceae bacterium]MBR3597944.1 bifunctional chorismate mutase/prephenate dehydratase [Clostridia bacterium]